MQFLDTADDMLVDVQRQIPVAQTMQKTMEVPPSHVTEKVSDIPVVAPRQILLMAQTVQKTTEILQLQFPDQVVDVPLAFVVLVPHVQVVAETAEKPQLLSEVQAPHLRAVEKTVEISQLQAVEKIVETRETQMIQSIQTSESLKPDDPDAEIKFLVEEELHGVGGFVFDTNGDRVVNELGGRNCVTGEMRKNKLPSRLDLDSIISDDIDWQCKHYTGRGVRKLHESGTTLAESREALVSKMPDSIEAHCQASLKSAKNPDGEPYPAFASEKPWNEASGKTGSEKKFYRNVSSGADFAAQPFCVAEYVEPAPVTTRTVAHRQVPHIQRVQKMVEVPQVQFIDKVVDIPVIRQRQMSVGVSGDCAESQGEEEQEEQEVSGSLVQGGEHRREEDETNPQVPGSELVQVAPNMGAGGSHPQATMDQGWDKELREIRRMIQFKTMQKILRIHMKIKRHKQVSRLLQPDQRQKQNLNRENLLVQQQPYRCTKENGLTLSHQNHLSLHTKSRRK